MSDFTINRRRCRSSITHEALGLQLASVCERYGLENAVLTTPAGQVIASAGFPVGDAPSDELAGCTTVDIDVLGQATCATRIEQFDIDADGIPVTLNVVTAGGEVERDGIEEARVGIGRILATTVGRTTSPKANRRVVL